MGAKSSRKSSKSGAKSDLDEGYFASFPSELIVHVISFLPLKDIQTCSKVCHLLRELIDSNSLWRVKCIREGRFVEAHMAPFYPADWREFYLKQPFTRNLIKNCSGQDGFKQWEILENGGDQWKVEEDGHYSKEKPSELLAMAGNKQCNFTTSYGWCTKRQTVDLVANGIDQNILDELQPPLKVGDWYAARYDCANIYKLEVTLMRDKEETQDNIIDTFVFEEETEQWGDNSWRVASHIFRDYGPGLRFVRFTHKSKDRQFWAGHYGSKMAGSYIRVSFRL